MLVKAIKSFSGTVTMASGDTRDIPEGAVLKDLLRAGFIVEAEPAAKKAAPAEDTAENANEENAPENGEEGAPAEKIAEVKPREAKRNKAGAN